MLSRFARVAGFASLLGAVVAVPATYLAGQPKAAPADDPARPATVVEVIPGYELVWNDEVAEIYFGPTLTARMRERYRRPEVV